MWDKSRFRSGFGHLNEDLKEVAASITFIYHLYYISFSLFFILPLQILTQLSLLRFEDFLLIISPLLCAVSC